METAGVDHKGVLDSIADSIFANNRSGTVHVNAQWYPLNRGT